MIKLFYLHLVKQTFNFLLRLNKLFIPITIIILIICIWFILYVKIKTKCDGWDIGLNNTRIYNNEDEYACQINLPKKCYINLFDGKLNMTKILNLKCESKSFS